MSNFRSCFETTDPSSYNRDFSNEGGDGNENGKKAIGLDWQNNNFAHASCFFVRFLAVVARLQHESAA